MRCMIHWLGVHWTRGWIYTLNSLGGGETLLLRDSLSSSGETLLLRDSLSSSPCINGGDHFNIDVDPPTSQTLWCQTPPRYVGHALESMGNPPRTSQNVSWINLHKCFQFPLGHLNPACQSLTHPEHPWKDSVLLPYWASLLSFPIPYWASLLSFLIELPHKAIKQLQSTNAFYKLETENCLSFNPSTE